MPPARPPGSQQPPLDPRGRLLDVVGVDVRQPLGQDGGVGQLAPDRGEHFRQRRRHLEARPLEAVGGPLELLEDGGDAARRGPGTGVVLARKGG